MIENIKSIPDRSKYLFNRNGGVVGSSSDIPKAATGMFTRESYYQNTHVGENNQEEMIVPLTQDRGSSFIQAIVEGVSGAIEAKISGGNVTFVAADKASLKKLERKLELIRLEEEQRKGG